MKLEEIEANVKESRERINGVLNNAKLPLEELRIFLNISKIISVSEILITLVKRYREGLKDIHRNSNDSFAIGICGKLLKETE